MHLRELVGYCDTLLAAASFSDYCPNGLQVEGRPDVRLLVGGVTACQALLEAALDLGADAILVHHGNFWRGEDARVTGQKRRRLATLLRHDLSLIAYHLPLDAHAEYGNNVALARTLGLRISGALDGGGRTPGLVLHGEPAAPLSARAFAQQIGHALGRVPLHIDAAGDDGPLRRIAWCTGAAAGSIDLAIAAGCDAYVTGEASEPAVHAAREAGVHFYAAGHHATERGGVQALGAHLAAHFGLAFRFVDIPNPV